MPLECLSNVAILAKACAIMPKGIMAYAAFKARLDKNLPRKYKTKLIPPWRPWFSYIIASPYSSPTLSFLGQV